MACRPRIDRFQWVPTESLLEKPQQMTHSIGIHLGTTTAIAAVSGNDRTTIVRGAAGNAAIPNVLAWNGGRWLVGEAAARRTGDVVWGLKNLLGRRPGEVQLPEDLPFEVVPDGDRLAIQCGERTFSVIELTGILLGTLRQNAIDQVKAPIEQAVLAVPAWFHDEQRMALKQAAEAAGLKVLGLVNEPTAAAMACSSEDAAGPLAVIDIEPGSCDATVLRYEGGFYEILATNGVLPTDLRPPADQDVDLNIEPMLEQFKKPLHQALADAAVDCSQLEQIFLVGTAARLPPVQTFIRDELRRSPQVPPNPEHAVALGAALQAKAFGSTNPARSGGSSADDTQSAGCAGGLLLALAAVYLLQRLLLS